MCSLQLLRARHGTRDLQAGLLPQPSPHSERSTTFACADHTIKFWEAGRTRVARRCLHDLQQRLERGTLIPQLRNLPRHPLA